MHGAAKESNLPPAGCRRAHGFEGRSEHRPRAAPGVRTVAPAPGPAALAGLARCRACPAPAPTRRCPRRCGRGCGSSRPSTGWPRPWRPRRPGRSPSARPSPWPARRWPTAATRSWPAPGTRRTCSPARVGGCARRCGGCSTRPASSSTPAWAGRPWPRPPRGAVARAAEGYANLELDLEDGARGSRHDHVEALLRELTGAEAAFVVNNCAAATLLAAAALAAGRDLVVSRGQLVEIGGGFRVPEVVAQAGARLVEVGTTNRTAPGRLCPGGARRRDEPGRSCAPPVELPHRRLRRGGRGRGPLLARRARHRRRRLGRPGRRPRPPRRRAPRPRSVRAGAALVAFSGDKLLGGPQAGLLVGTREAVAACRRHPLARAVRIDKLSLAALEATLRLHRDPALARRELPVLAMLTADDATLRARGAAPGRRDRRDRRRGGRPRRRRGAAAARPARARRRAAGRRPGGAGRALRRGEPPVVARIADGRVVLDPRTLTDAEVAPAAAAVRAARA